MRTVRIMCNDHDVIYPDGHIVGKIGEHNATMLEIRTTDDFVIGCDYFSIEIFRNEHVFYSGTITDDMGGDDNSYRAGCVFYLKLWHNLTLGKQINIVVVGYKTLPNGNAEEVRRSPVIGSLLFTGAFGCDKESEYAGGITAEVAELSRRVVELKGTDDDFFTEIEAIRNDIPSSVDIARWDGAATEIHTHPNKPTLDRLTEVDGVLYLDGKRLDGVIVWPIQKDPVIPAQPDGTLLYTVYGENGLMHSDPYLVEIQGVLYRKPAPWKPGQLWVCRGGIWYLLTAEGKTVFDPSEVAQGRDDGFGGIDEEEVFAPAPLPDDGGGADTDDVVLLPMGEPLHLIARADFGSAPMYAMESFIRQNDPKYDFYVDGADGTRIRIACNGFDVFLVEVNGTGYEIGAVELPETFTVTSVNGYASLEEMPSDILEAYRTFCSFVNTSAEAMGSGVPISGKAEIPTVGLLWNRTYAMRLDYVDNDSIEIFFAENADDGMIAKEAYTTVYVYFPQDIDAAISGVDYFVGGVPQTTQGLHKWIFNRLPNGQVSLGSLEFEAIV